MTDYQKVVSQLIYLIPLSKKQLDIELTVNLPHMTDYPPSPSPSPFPNLILHYAIPLGSLIVVSHCQLVVRLLQSAVAC